MILVYQMGKVGSCSIYNLLKQTQKQEVYHIHHLFTNLHSVEKKDIAANILKKISSTPTKIKIITLVRNPLKRNISAFFQNFENFIKKEEDMSQVDTVFWNKYDQMIPNNWFDNELKKLTDIDVYEIGFNLKKGYHIYENSKFSVLVLKLEDLDKNIKVLNNFLNIKIDKFLELNISADKKYYGHDNYLELYTKIISNIDQDKIKLIASSKYIKTFYPHLDLLNLS
jgi:hypothetical protein